MFRSLLGAITIVLATGAQADVRPEVEELLDALLVPDLMEIMSEEGTGYGDLLEEELFPGRGGPAWDAVVRQTYDPSGMYATFAEAFDTALGDDDVAPITGFFTSERGARIVGFEISARRALLQEGIEEAATDTYLRREAEGDDRLAQVAEFIEVNDLVESNVMGALNSNYAFYIGLIDGNAFPQQLTEQQVLADVWGQEQEIRDDTIEWIHSYLLMAYQPLSDEDLEIYIAMSQTEGGRTLNRALFAAFDEVFVGISRALGLAAASFIAGQDI